METDNMGQYQEVAGGEDGMEPMDSIPGPPGDLPDPGGIPIAEPALDPAANSEGNCASAICTN